MRLKTFHADTMNAAMALVREQLGSDAIIVATHDDETGRGVRITAAVEDLDDGPIFDGEHENWDIVDIVCDALDRHGTPASLTELLLNAVTHVGGNEDATLALAAAFDSVFKFSPLPSGGPARPFVFFGPPGNGKTVAIAKLAARARLAGNAVRIVAADNVRAGARAQLEAYAERLSLEIEPAADAASLAELIASAATTKSMVLIDTAGVNPYDVDDIAALLAMIDGLNAERILVVGASCDPGAATDLANAFKGLNPSRLLVTGLDMTRRLGGILAIAHATNLPFCDVSLSPAIADGLHPINPVSLARLLLPDMSSQSQQGDNRANASGAR